MIIGLIAAMENELSPFLTFFSTTRKEIFLKTDFYFSSYSDHQLILVCSGRGKVNSAIVTQQLISHYAPDILFNVGVSGGIEETSVISDIYVGIEYCHYDVRKRQSENTFPHKLYFQGDASIIKQLSEMDISVKYGIFGTGEGFVANQMMKEYIYEEFGVCAVDMESAAIAQCCYINDTRFLSIRGICDKADEKAIFTEEDLQERISATMVELFAQLLKKI